MALEDLLPVPPDLTANRPVNPDTAYSSEDDFWEKDAGRVNRLGDVASENGHVVRVLDDDTLPELNEDGGLADPDSEGGEAD